MSDIEHVVDAVAADLAWISPEPVYVGGATIGLFLDALGRSQLRATLDVDCIVPSVVTRVAWWTLEEGPQSGGLFCVLVREADWRRRARGPDDEGARHAVLHLPRAWHTLGDLHGGKPIMTLKALILGALLAGCGTKAPDEGCVAGVEHACACDGAGAGVKVCGDAGVFGECDCAQACAPTTCDAEGVTCGPLDDGCGSTLDCGACPTDACAEGTDDCDEHAACTPDGDTFTCACDDGYLGDGKTCDPDRDTMVADLGDAEVEVTIDGVGVVHVGRLSKISIRVDMARVPATIGFRPFPTHVSLPPVTIGDVRGAPSVITALRAWTASGTPRAITVRLVGLGDEWDTVRSGLVTPSELDPTVSTAGGDSVLASMRLQPVERWEVTDRQEMFEDFWPIYRPGTEVEIAGITGWHGCSFDQGIVQLALTDTVLVLPTCADGSALITWMRVNLDWFDQLVGGYEWRSLSVIDFDAGGVEIFRRNAYEVLPKELLFFDPTKPYGSSSLITIVMELGFVENG